MALAAKKRQQVYVRQVIFVIGTRVALAWA
jgi:hypothetical protein